MSNKFRGRLRNWTATLVGVDYRYTDLSVRFENPEVIYLGDKGWFLNKEGIGISLESRMYWVPVTDFRKVNPNEKDLLKGALSPLDVYLYRGEVEKTPGGALVWGEIEPAPSFRERDVAVSSVDGAVPLKEEDPAPKKKPGRPPKKKKEISSVDDAGSSVDGAVPLKEEDPAPKKKPGRPPKKKKEIPFVDDAGSSVDGAVPFKEEDPAPKKKPGRPPKKKKTEDE